MTNGTWSRGDTFGLGIIIGAILMTAVVIGIFSLTGNFKTDCDQHIIDAATEQIDERLEAELVLCDYEGLFLP